jgi:hypothetical protein
MEGISDHHATSSFTSRRSRWSWLLHTSSDPCTEAQSRRHGDSAAPAKAGEAEGGWEAATEVSEARSRQCRGSNTPTLVAPPQGKDHEVSCCTSIRRSDPGRRENVWIPGHAVRSPRLRGVSPLRKWRERARNARGAGARSSFGWQTSIGRIVRLSCREVARPRGEEGR